jgi:hypothetical protein
MTFLLRTCVVGGQQQAVDTQRLHRGAAATQLMIRNAAHVDQEHPQDEHPQRPAVISKQQQ